MGDVTGKNGKTSIPGNAGDGKADPARPRVVTLPLGPITRNRSTESPRLMPDAGKAEQRARILRLPIPDAQPSSITPVFETIRIIELARLRVALRRKAQARAGAAAGASSLSPEKFALLEVLEQFHATTRGDWPEVIVIRQSQTSVLQTNFAVLGTMVYLGAHLSKTWEEGKEAPEFYTSLADALKVMLRNRGSHFEAAPPIP